MASFAAVNEAAMLRSLRPNSAPASSDTMSSQISWDYDGTSQGFKGSYGNQEVWAAMIEN